MLTKKRELIDEEKHISENPKTVIEYETELTNILLNDLQLPSVITDIIFDYNIQLYVRGEYAERMNISKSVKCSHISCVTLVEDKLFVLDSQTATDNGILYTWCCTKQRIIKKIKISLTTNDLYQTIGILLSKNIILIANQYVKNRIVARDLINGRHICHHNIEFNYNAGGGATWICGLTISTDGKLCYIANFCCSVIKVYDTTYFKKIGDLKLKNTICRFDGSIINTCSDSTFSHIQQYQDKLFAFDGINDYVAVFDTRNFVHVDYFRMKDKNGEYFSMNNFSINKDYIYVISHYPRQKSTVNVYDLNGIYVDSFDELPRYKFNKSISINGPCHIISHNKKVFVMAASPTALNTKNNTNQSARLVEKIIMYS